MNLIRSTVTINLTIEQVNEINELIVRDEALPVIPYKDEPEKWSCCPQCRRLLNHEDNFCRECGQRVDTDNYVL